MKETTSQVKRQPSEWKKIRANKATDKELIAKIQFEITPNLHAVGKIF